MSTQQRTRIYLLTVWQEDDETWRFLLEDPRSNKRKGFASIQAMIDGLLETVVVERENLGDTDSAPSPGC